jgi:hypothetical protein
VRRKAIFILSEKVLIKFITIEKRLFILNHALKDKDEGVIDTCCKKLLPSWLAFKENDLVKLLKALDVVDALDTAELMLNSMFRDYSIGQITQEFVHLLDEKHLIPFEKLDPESVLYWSWVCSKCKNANVATSKDKADQNDVTDDENRAVPEHSTNDTAATVSADRTIQIESEESLDRLLPSLTEFCEYIKKVFAQYDQEWVEKAQDDKFQIETTFVVKQLFKMFMFIDFSDRHGKRMLISFCEELLAKRSFHFLFESIMKVYKVLVPNLNQRIKTIVELISDLRENNMEAKEAENRQEEQIRYVVT